MKVRGYLTWLKHAYLLSHSHTMLLGPPFAFFNLLFVSSVT